MTSADKISVRDGLLAMIRNGSKMTLRQQLHLTVVLSIPAILAQLSAIIMQYIDAAMVGSLGTEASASIGLMATSTWLFWGLCTATAVGFSVQVAHRIGASDMKGARSVMRQSFVVTLVFSSLLAIVGVAVSGFLPRWLGVTGAAIGTGLAEFCGGVYLMWYLCWRNRDLNLRGRRGSFRPTRECLRRAFNIGAPIGAEHLLMCGAQVLTTVIVAPLGAVAIAANAFAVTAESLCYMPGYGISEAATTLVGQSLGAARKALARRFAYITVISGITIMSIMGVVMYFGAPLMMGIITPVAEICQMGVEVLRIEAWAEPMFAASIVAYGVFVGAGDTLVPCGMNLASIWGVRLTLAALLAPTMGLQGVWLAMAIELGFRGAIFLWRLRGNSWINRYVAPQQHT